ncbi:TonB family protein [Bordetella sp. BOR01]|uniref:TonB family protein n=1 Tax=Bordetella sp. BOR01 TaxID=2854779 RepID=UPI001C448782|nr:TonB family protein [Bordetella sp. BOR01]MBV7483506.1 TonB family protein [Bordetella sp. BOR01]
MQAIFSVLGIAPTRDTKAIRRAYAQRLKTLDQHTQAGEFEELRSAYETAINWAAQADTADDLPDAAVPAPFADDAAVPLADDAAFPGHVPPEPRQPLHQVPQDAALRSARERRRVVDTWVDELMHAQPQDLPATWKRLRADPALESLDSMADLGDRLLEGIAGQPDGQYALYSLAQHHFHWDQAAYRPRAPHAAQWLQRYTEERELWEQQPRKQRLRYERAIERMRRHPSPSWLQASQAEPAIHHASRHMPLWWSLHVPAALARQYTQALQSLPLLVRGIRKLRSIEVRWPKWYIWLFVGILAHGLSQWLSPPASSPAPSSQASPQAAPDPANQLRQVTTAAHDKRIYLITGPVAATSHNGNVLLEVPIPAYPKDAQDAQGTVQVTLTLTTGGEVQAAVTQSSGSASLDAAALAAAQAAQFEGKLAYAVHARLPFAFRAPR